MSPQAPIRTVHIYIATALMIVTAVLTSFGVGQKIGETTSQIQQLVVGQAQLVKGQEQLTQQIKDVAKQSQGNRETNIDHEGRIKVLERPTPIFNEWTRPRPAP